MKILWANPSSIYLQDLLAVLSTINPDITIWYPDQTSIYSILDYHKDFDLFFCETKYITDLVIEAIEEYKLNTISFGIKTKQFTHNKLACLTKYDIGELFPEDFSDYYLLTPAANKSTDNNIHHGIYYICTKDNENIQYLLDNDIPLIIVGPNKLPYPNYLGTITTKDRLDIFSSASLVILEDNLYMFDVAMSKCLAIVGEENTLYPDYNCKEVLLDYINMAQANDGNKISKNKLIDKNYNFAKQNTFYHRLHEIFSNIDQLEMANKCLQQL